MKLHRSNVKSKKLFRSKVNSMKLYRSKEEVRGKLIYLSECYSIGCSFVCESYRGIEVRSIEILV